ncbi:MAG: ferredoxin [Vampirovibrionales bacterium]|nr:ferredoxin [Vampirovibrionales bacterium]
MQVTIVPGCIACGVCEALCPEVFTVTDTSVAENSNVPGHEAACREAAKACPVDVIKIEE